MKKALALFLSMVLVLSLAACSSANSVSTASSDTTSESKSEQTSENKVLYMIALSDTGPYWNPLLEGATSRAEELGYNLVLRTGVSGDPNRPQKLLEATQEGINEGAAAIGLAAIDPSMFDKKAKEALDAGIPVVTYDTDVKTPANRVAYVGTDNYKAGELLGEKAANDLIAKGVTEGSLSMMVYNGSAQNMIDRMNGAKEGFEKAMGDKMSNFKWLSTIINENNAGEGKRQLESQIIANPDIKAIFTFGVESVITGTMEAMRSQNMGGKMYHYGFDFSPTFEIGIADEYITAIVDQDCKAIGSTLVDTMIAASTGKPFEENNPIPANWVVAEDLMAYGKAKTEGK